MNRDGLYLRHIRDAIDRIEQYKSVGQELFLTEPQGSDATIGQLLVIGEAVKRLSPDLRQRHAALPWRQIAGLLDVLVHEYDEVDLALVSQIVETDLPRLEQTVLRQLDELQSGT